MPKLNKASHRATQLRLAKRAQRARDAAVSLVPCQVKLHATTARKLREALSVAGVEQALDEFLDEAVVDARAYPSLHALLWNRRDPRIASRDAFALYERHWRLIDLGRTSDAERQFIDRLAQRFGNGVLNV